MLVIITLYYILCELVDSWLQQILSAFAVQRPAIQQLSQRIAMRVKMADQNQKRRSALSLRNGLAERRRLNSPNPIKIAPFTPLQTHQTTDQNTISTKINPLRTMLQTRNEGEGPNGRNVEGKNDNQLGGGFVNPSQTKKQSIPSKQEKLLRSQITLTTNSQGLPQRGVPLDTISNSSIGRLRQQNNQNPYKIIVHQQHKSDPRLPSSPTSQETGKEDFLKKHKTTSDPIINTQKYNQNAEQVASNSSVVLQSKDMMDSLGGNNSNELVSIRISEASHRDNAPLPLPPLKESINLPKENSHTMKDSFGLNRSSSNQAISRQMKDSIKLMKESSVIQTFKGGNLRRCISVEFQKKEERRMKLRDYLYLNEISGVRKKVPIPKQSSNEQIKTPHAYTRVRQFSSDQILQSKIKQDIQQNVRRVCERLQLLGEMGDFNGDKLLLYNINAILKDKVEKACDEIHLLIQRYQQQLI